MIQLEIDNISLEVKEGTMLIEAARQAEVFIPHFCYHPKLSIAANCRMCLVEVEKAPKPMPACATPVTQGMKVYTQSEKAKAAQKSVMEFLLINHPLDCPICDQGGECQLQDLSVGYGGSKSRYQEEKRVVLYKDVGSLISMQEMSRCIHCTRCVRFGQEIAGVMELGMLNRGEHSEITSFVGEAVSSELSGNMIDICPVGALTSKPFRYQARTWELKRLATISPHDAIGSALVAQTKNQKLMRVIAGQNDELNESWITDRDHFSYEALDHSARLAKPMVRDQSGQMQSVDWSDALQAIYQQTQYLKEQKLKSKHPLKSLGFINPAQTLEEMFLFKHYLNAISGQQHAQIEFRFKQADLAFDEVQTPKAMLNSSFKAFEQHKDVFVLGSFLKNDQPLLAARLRKMAKHGKKIHNIHALSGADWGLDLQTDELIAPHLWASYFLCVKQFLYNESITVRGLPEVYVQKAKRLAAYLLERKPETDASSTLFILGSAILSHPKRSFIHDTLMQIAKFIHAQVHTLIEAANTLGAYALEMYTPLNTSAITHTDDFSHLQTADILFNFNVDAKYDVADMDIFNHYLQNASLKVYLGAFVDQQILNDYDIILPIATHFETSGSVINLLGQVQNFQGVAKPFGEARPAWKVFKVLNDMSGATLPLYTSTQDIFSEIKISVQQRLQELALKTNHILNLENHSKNPRQNNAPIHFERLSYTPIYSSDALVRHADALQKTPQAKALQYIYAHPSVLNEMALKEGAMVSILQGQKMINAPIKANQLLDPMVLLIPMASQMSRELGGMYGDVAIEKNDHV
jgi:NADH-quinone oxidoreductase subunit G